MLKVRLQGTVKDIQWFGKLLQQHPKIRVLGVSKPFANKGTNKYFRVYAEIEKRENSETDFNETDNILSNPSHLSVRKTAGMIDMVEEMEAYRKIIRENISYECFEDSRYRQQEEVDELVELMVEVMVMPDNSTVRIGGVDKPVVIVKNRFMKVEHGHIEYVVGCLEKNTSKVGNIRAYLLTTLYNSTMTIENYYRAEVNHDMYGGG